MTRLVVHAGGAVEGVRAQSRLRDVGNWIIGCSPEEGAPRAFEESVHHLGFMFLTCNQELMLVSVSDETE